jgi:lipopolysaccharide/colanic/teichoic acid biosynthesis glycosyltransferase
MGYALKRMFDVPFSAVILLLTGPILLSALLAVWLQDFKDPFYRAKRVARGGGDFTMLKIRSMVVDAEMTGVNSTGAGDSRITKVGQLIRRYKLDELSQFINVLLGDMSVVGPRPNTRACGVELYTDEEKRLLDVRPGITDLSSIVFSDEGDILNGESDPDAAYNRIIRPWKSRLGLFYVDHASLGLDLRIVWLTILAVTNKPKALKGVVAILTAKGAPNELIEVCRRIGKVPEGHPPGQAAPDGFESAGGAASQSLS